MTNFLKPNNFWHFLGLNVLFTIIIKLTAMAVGSDPSYTFRLVVVLAVQVVLAFTVFKYKLYYAQSLFRRQYKFGGCIVALLTLIALIVTAMAVWFFGFALIKWL